MAKPSAAASKKSEASRNLVGQLSRSVRQMKAGKVAHEHRIKIPEALEVRLVSGLSQQKFADVLGVSARTLQEWEQGRRQPSGAARALLAIAKRRPDVLREVFAR
jgi:putative transcriptional regulator